MRLRVSRQLNEYMHRASVWSGVPLSNIVRRALRKYENRQPDLTMYDGDEATTGGTVHQFDVPAEYTCAMVRTIIMWYLDGYKIPATVAEVRSRGIPASSVTTMAQLDGIDYLIEENEE